MSATARGNRREVPQRRESDRLAARLREVSDAALAVTSELDLDSALQKAVDSARELVHARYAALGVAKPGLTGLSRFITSGIEPKQIAAIGHWPRGLGLLGVLLREPKPLRVRNVAEDPRSTASVAIENARRFTETSTRLQQSLLEIKRAEERSRFLAELSGLLPIGPIVEQIPWECVADRATELLGDGCVIYLIDPDVVETVRTRVVRHQDPARAEAVGGSSRNPGERSRRS